MIEARFDINLSDVQAGLNAVLNTSTGSQRRDFFQELKQPLKDDVREHQDEKRGEGGSSWPPYSPATYRPRSRNARGQFKSGGGKKRKGRRKPQDMLRRVPRAWKSYIDADHLKLLNMISWADVHDGGGTAGKGARIPRRQFAYISESMVQEAIDIWQDNALDAWNKK